MRGDALTSSEAVSINSFKSCFGRQNQENLSAWRHKFPKNAEDNNCDGGEDSEDGISDEAISGSNASMACMWHHSRHGLDDAARTRYFCSDYDHQNHHQRCWTVDVDFVDVDGFLRLLVGHFSGLFFLPNSSIFANNFLEGWYFPTWGLQRSHLGWIFIIGKAVWWNCQMAFKIPLTWLSLNI